MRKNKIYGMLGVLFVVAGIILGVYMGLWIGFIGGIVQVVEAIKAPEVESMSVALGAARVFFSGVLGFITLAASWGIASFFIHKGGY